MKISDIRRYDSEKMYEAYDYWPKSAKEHYEKDFSKLEIDNVDHIVFAGMGGSGTIGDIISSILSKTNIHVNVVKGYLLLPSALPWQLRYLLFQKLFCLVSQPPLFFPIPKID